MLKKFFAKKIAPVELKGYSPYSALFTPYSGNAFSFATTNLKWMQYYSTVAPVGDAVNKVADKGSKIDLMLFAPDKKEAELPVTKHPFLNLLNNRPNKYQTSQQFKKEMIVHERACGNNYLRLIGGISAGKDKFVGEPVAMFNLRPDFMTAIVPDPVDGRALYYQYTEPNGAIRIFYRREMRAVDGRLIDTYIDESGSSQLYAFKNLSSRRLGGYYQLYGDAPLQAAEIQIAQYFEAAVYNYFLILNGLSARKLISLDSKTEIFTQAQKDSLKRFVEENFSGAVNSGKSVVAPIPLKVEDLQMALKDMDFKTLNETTMEAVYRALNIPLPIIGADNTSMNNMDISSLMFFDDGVLPPLDNMCENLFYFPFADRYKDASQFLDLSYNESAISALQPRVARNLKLQKEAGVSTINELREYQGLGRVNSDGCDQIYIGSNQIAIGTDTNLQDTIGTDKPDQTDDEGLKKEWLLAKKADGSPLFSEETIRLFS